MKTVKCILIIFLLLGFSKGFSQIDLSQSPYETKFDKIKKKNLEIMYKGKSFSFGDSFGSVDKKIGESAVYSGGFDANSPEYSFFEGKADYMINFEGGDFFFRKGVFSYFEIRSGEFSVKLRSEEENNGVVTLRVGKSVNVMSKIFKKSFESKLTKGDADHDAFIVNIGDLNGADSEIANNLIILVNKGTDKISMINFYGY